MTAELFGEAVARGMRLAIEYRPAPPFEGGSPHTAPEAVVRTVRAAGAERLARRRAIVAPLGATTA